MHDWASLRNNKPAHILFYNMYDDRWIAKPRPFLWPARLRAPRFFLLKMSKKSCVVFISYDKSSVEYGRKNSVRQFIGTKTN